MEDKYADLRQELLKLLTERLLANEYDLGKRNFFFLDVEIEQYIFDILLDQIHKKTAYAETVHDFLFEKKLKREAFDRQVRECVYDDLYKALGGLK